MKKGLLLPVLGLILFCTSCSKDSSDEENENIAKELIIGKWEFVRISSSEHGEGDFSACNDPSFNFYNNGTVVREYCNYGEYGGEYLITGNLLELEHENQYSGGIERMRANIERITSEEMVLEVEDGYFDEGAVTLYLEKAN